MLKKVIVQMLGNCQYRKTGPKKAKREQILVLASKKSRLPSCHVGQNINMEVVLLKVHTKIALL
jgi:hypothetical protein